MIALLMTLIIFMTCLLIGSVSIPFKESLPILKNFLMGQKDNSQYGKILVSIRLPRVLTTFLMGMALSLSGMTMQSLLKNPLADGSTLGISAGASLGAVLAIVSGVSLPLAYFKTSFMLAVVFAFLSLVLILFFTYQIDPKMNNMTVILTGIIFSMLVSSALNLIIVFADDKLKSIIFWTMGSLAGATYADVGVLLVALILGGLMIWVHATELNAFAVSENMARNIGVDVFKTRILLFIAIAILIGISVAVAGTIPFVGLIIPHMARMLVGNQHQRLIPATLFLGGNFMMVADLIARTIASPLELPVGVITSLVGTLTFFYIFYQRGGRRV